jgi:hypothetical protein
MKSFAMIQTICLTGGATLSGCMGDWLVFFPCVSGAFGWVCYYILLEERAREKGSK